MKSLQHFLAIQENQDYETTVGVKVCDFNNFFPNYNHVKFARCPSSTCSY